MNNFLAIRTYDNYINANMELGVLQQSGIRCYLQDEHTLTIDPLLIPALGGIKLMVLQNEAKIAFTLLENNDTLYLESIACPDCGQKTLQKVVIKKTFNSFAGRLWSMLVNGQSTEEKTSYKCFSCGNVFEEKPLQSNAEIK